MAGQARLPFEKEIAEMEQLLARLEADDPGANGEEVRRIRRELVSLLRKKYSALSAWETVQVARHVDRPRRRSDTVFGLNARGSTCTGTSVHQRAQELPRSGSGRPAKAS